MSTLFSHVAYRRPLYGGTPTATVTERRRDPGAIDLLDAGLVGRGRAA